MKISEIFLLITISDVDSLNFNIDTLCHAVLICTI